MARPLRLEFPGASYHVTARGNAQGAIFLDDHDRERFLALFERVVKRYEWVCHAYCLMGNHFHLVVETPRTSLAAGVRYLNGVYAQAFNHRHRRSGHVFGERFKSVLVEKDEHLMAAAAYVVNNPVRLLDSRLVVVTVRQRAPRSAGALSHARRRGGAAAPRGGARRDLSRRRRVHRPACSEPTAARDSAAAMATARTAARKAVRQTRRRS